MAKEGRRGLCIYLWGLPVIESSRCAEERRDDRAERQAQRQGKAVDKKRQRELTKRQKQKQKTKRRQSKDEADVLQTALRTAPGATVPGAEVVGEIGDVALGVGAILGSLSGSSSPATQAAQATVGGIGVDTNTLILAGAAVVGVGILATSRR